MHLFDDEAIQKRFARVEDGVREARLDYAPRRAFLPFHLSDKRWSCLVCHRRAGKALDVATPIPMADGTWSTMGELRAGQRVFDEQGLPCTVVEAHPVMLGRPCYKVQFSDGAEIVCDEDHLWMTQTKLDRAHHKRFFKGPRGASVLIRREHAPKPGTVKTTAEIRNTLDYQGERNHSIPLAGPLDYAPAVLLVEPYILGLWLGDGSSRGPHVTTADDEIVASLGAFATENGFKFHAVHSANTGKATTYSIAGERNKSFTAMLRVLDVLNNKHIPLFYKASSIDQRIDLVRGLMDTDGSIGTKSRCEITFKSSRLIEDFADVVRSLGVKVTVRKRVLSAGEYWRASFRPWFCPFLLQRKAIRWQKPHETRAFSQKRYIVAVKPVPSRAVRCITVDSPSRLYLCGREMIPTHNTVASVRHLEKAAIECQLPNPRFAYIAPLYKQAKDVAWTYLKDGAAPLVPLGARIHESELRVDYPGGGRVRLYGADNPDALRGIYLDGVVLDEYADMRPDMWNSVIRPALADRKGFAVFIGTPKGRDNFYETWRTALKSPDEWFALMLKASESGLLDPAELAKAKAEMDDSTYLREFECSFEEADVNQFISTRECLDAVAREEAHDGMPILIGVDVARFGDDSSCIVVRRGDTVVKVRRLRANDTMDLVGHVTTEIEQYAPQQVFVDGVGVGGGVVDRMRQLGHRVVDVSSGTRAIQSQRYVNLRAEMWGNMREWLRTRGRIPNDTELIDDLVTPLYSFDHSNRIKLERKEDMKSRGLPSPDSADALALTFAFPVATRADWSESAAGRAGAQVKVRTGSRRLERLRARR